MLCVARPVVGAWHGFRLAGREAAGVELSPSEKPVVHTALSILQRDVRAVLGDSLRILPAGGDIVAGTVGEGGLVEKTGADLDALEGRKQAFLLSVLPDGRLLVAGSDSHGTAYGLMEVSRLLGVSPWEWWADATPETRTHFELPAGYRDLQFPSVEYRGIFINDEDWGLMPWSSTCYELGIRKGASGRARTSAFLSCSCACGPTSIGLPCTNAPSHSS